MDTRDPDDDGTAPSTLSSHVDARGRARMVDVAAKPVTHRRAVATAFVAMAPATVAVLRDPALAAPKGDVLAVARLAGIMAAKRTPELIPLCHGVALTRVVVELAVEDRGVAIAATAEALDRTGVEMEALTAASIAALTVYDMLKGRDRAMVVERVALQEKDGGRSGRWVRGDDAAP
jgi:cyclic pyranopterin phosphate synthase